jgi:MoaA/NifB/PqqE/SkfB family radical SAM enzyme
VDTSHRPAKTGQFFWGIQTNSMADTVQITKPAHTAQPAEPVVETGEGPPSSLFYGPVGALMQKLLRPYLYHVIVHITDRCNLRCKTCFIEFGRKDLSVEEARVLSGKLGYIPALDLGGGEPFLHKDLPGLCREFRFGSVTIPTNGQFQDRVIESVKVLLKEHPGKVTIALSLDGPEEINNAIRGPRTYEKALATYHELRKLDGLTLKVNTVVNNRNADRIVEFVREIRQLNPDYHSLLLLRGDPLAPEEVQLPDMATLRAITPELLAILRTYTFGHRFNFLLRQMKYNYQRYMWNIQLDMIEHQRAPFQCKAPRYNKVVYADGQTSMCELMPRLDNLLESTPEAVDTKLRNHLQDFEAKNGKCFCTHNCNISENIMTHPPSVAKVLLGLSR